MPKKNSETVVEDEPVVASDGATFVDESADAAAPFTASLTEKELEEDVPEVAPEKGVTGQVPVMTPGVLAPVSSKLLPNAERDARKILAEREAEGRDEGAIKTIRFDMDADGPRDARDLAILLRRYPHLVNNLDQLEDLERREYGVKNPDPWVRDPVDLLDEAQKYNMLFIGNDGNFLPHNR